MSDLWTKVKCWWRGHVFVVEKRLSAQSVMVRCRRCGGHFAYNHFMGAIIPWSAKVDEFYRYSGRRSGVVK